jgi:arsenite methyltransferase
LTAQGLDIDELARQIEGKFMSAFIRANKSAGASCCGPSCCS